MKNISQQGFSLIELMIAIAIAGIVLAGIYAAYLDQLRTAVTQERTVDMTQNLRAVNLAIERDLRMAGTDPTREAKAGFLKAEAGEMIIAMDNGGRGAVNDLTDNDGDGLVDEADEKYWYEPIDDTVDNDNDDLVDEGSDGFDNDGDGLIDEFDEAEWFDGDIDDEGEILMFDVNADNELRRRYNQAGNTDITNTDPTKTQSEILAQNIDALNFVYFDGSNPPQRLGDAATPVAGAARDDIRSVQVTILIREGDEAAPMARPYINRNVYTNPQGDVLLDLSAAPDNIRRRILVTTIKCRNMGS